jgi:4a-hydroxytetrahydrobiopterin dehydratase
MPMTHDDIRSRLRNHPGWQLQGDAVARQFSFASFPDAIAFVTRLGFDAEAHDHHPDLLVRYRRVTVTWSTHDEGGVTERDFAGIEQTDRAAALFPHAQ